MAGGIATVLNYRLHIDAEFQGWVLLFASVTCIFFFCLPCYCAGLSFTPARRFAAWLSQRLPSFYLVISIFNFVFMFLVVQWLPDWEFSQYVAVVLKTVLGTVKHLIDGAMSIAIIVGFCFAIAFKDRIAQLFGFDHKTLFRFKLRDCLTCLGTSRFQPIELSIWKVEDLQSADPFSANNVFVEFFLGYNEPMTTRVHNNAGSACFLKENMQLNFDEDDEEEVLFIFVRNQKVMGTSELARAEIAPGKLREMVQKSRMYGENFKWTEEFFAEPIQLIPRGRIFLRARPVTDDDYNQGFLQELTTC